jgi:hypothetical protein
MKTVISHFYNEEYLLPHWLNHHKKYFDHGIMIDYHSTDNSVNIIKEICPDWEVITSRNAEFSAKPCDDEVVDIEKTITGWKIALCITEFLVGDYDKLESMPAGTQLLIPAYVMVDPPHLENVEVEGNLLETRRFGYGYEGAYFKDMPLSRLARSFHNFDVNYSYWGRHFKEYNTTDFAIMWYSFAPWTEGTINRKLQIQSRMSAEDKKWGNGWHHIITKEQLTDRFKEQQMHVRDLNDELLKYFVK